MKLSLLKFISFQGKIPYLEDQNKVFCEKHNFAIISEKKKNHVSRLSNLQIKLGILKNCNAPINSISIFQIEHDNNLIRIKIQSN